MKKAIVIPNKLKDDRLYLTKSVIEKLNRFGVIAYLGEEYFDNPITGAIPYVKTPDDAEVIIVVGGDGSVIDASVMAVEMDIPIIGINLGKVGYLTTLDPDNLDVLAGLAKDEYIISEKMLLSAEKVTKESEIIKSSRLALNDVIICHDSYLGIADFQVANAGGDSVIYRADGVVISTPAGSTAYSLSAGGPVISHTLDSIMVTPVCPHSFFNRAIVYGPEEKITITNLSDIVLNISVDGRLFSSLKSDERCVISKSERRIKMLTFSESNLFTTLSKKIKLLHDSV